MYSSHVHLSVLLKICILQTNYIQYCLKCNLQTIIVKLYKHMICIVNTHIFTSVSLNSLLSHIFNILMNIRLRVSFIVGLHRERNNWCPNGMTVIWQPINQLHSLSLVDVSLILAWGVVSWTLCINYDAHIIYIYMCHNRKRTKPVSDHHTKQKDEMNMHTTRIHPCVVMGNNEKKIP